MVEFDPPGRRIPRKSATANHVRQTRTFLRENGILMSQARVRIRFWGVRGSTPTPQVENLTFGGNTSCVEIRTAANECVIFDAGTGIRNLGRCLVEEAAGEPVKVQLFLTHFHWDHIQGIPFFAPIYGPRNHISFYTGLNGGPLQEILEGQMAKPYFPVDFAQVAARRNFNLIEPGASVSTCGMKVTPFPLNHPQNACGYRVEIDGAVIVYATDYEHGAPGFDKTLRDYAQGADVLICDAQYTPEEYESHRGWGHSTWLNATHVARDAHARQLLLFHHDPTHDDQSMMRIAEDSRMRFENTTAAWEGFAAAF
jgi:phosphoribosyl 1,2-cyclic phosphodiesterase